MADEKPEAPDKTTVFELAEPMVRRPFLGANARTARGTALFPEIGSQMTLDCIAVEPFTKPERPQPALILKDHEGTEYIRVLGKMNQLQLAEIIKSNNAMDALGWRFVFESYDTGSTGNYQYGLNIISGSKQQKQGK